MVFMFKTKEQQIIGSTHSEDSIIPMLKKLRLIDLNRATKKT